ncbi:hypothetical protein [Mesorhizobium sp.]|nr:hypothetical protein [Mesorhizobium sp.]
MIGDLPAIERKTCSQRFFGVPAASRITACDGAAEGKDGDEAVKDIEY